MIKEEGREAITAKDELVEQMVSKTYKSLRDLGELETVTEIFGKLPISRIQKEQYNFLFDSVRQNVQELLARQNTLKKILNNEQEKTAKVEVRSNRDRGRPQGNEERQGKVVSLGNYDFDHLFEQTLKEKLSSGRLISQSILYLRNQQRSNNKNYYGEEQAFLPDQQYIDINKVQAQIPSLRMFMEEKKPLKRFQLEFKNENSIEFCNRALPEAQDIEERADLMAKLVLLQLYRQQGRKAKHIYKNNQIEVNKQREIRKIKQEMEVEQMKEGEMIEEMDLIKQVYKILVLIQNKMNKLAFQEFQAKRGQRATQIKRSLEKIKRIINEQPSAKNKLNILIAYKHRKGW